MAFDGHPGRIRALERQLVGSEPTAVIITGWMTPEEIAEAERVVAEARARGRDLVVVRICVAARPA